MESLLCFLLYLLLNSEAAAFRADDADFFSCVLRLSRLHSQRSGRAGRHCEFVGVGRRLLRLCEHYLAEQNRCSQRREAHGVCREAAGWLESLTRRG